MDQETLQTALAGLRARDPAFVDTMIEKGGRPIARRRAPGFQGLAWIVVSQLFVAIATIWAAYRALVRERVG